MSLAMVFKMINANQNLNFLKDKVLQLEFQFQNTALCRRVSGVYSNQVSSEAYDQAHALLVERKDGTFVVGVSSPSSKPKGAEKLIINFLVVVRLLP